MTKIFKQSIQKSSYMAFLSPTTLALLVALLLSFVSLSVQAQSLSLNIIQWSGDENHVSVASIDKITFSEDNLIVNYEEGSTESIDLLSIRKITFSIPMGIDKIENGKEQLSVFFISANQLMVNNLPEGKHPVSIYSVSGNLIQSTTIDSYSPTINVDTMQKGMYIVMINNQTLKIVKL
jgi:hypothetical protein